MQSFFFFWSAVAAGIMIDVGSTSGGIYFFGILFGGLVKTIVFLFIFYSFLVNELAGVHQGP